MRIATGIRAIRAPTFVTNHLKPRSRTFWIAYLIIKLQPPSSLNNKKLQIRDLTKEIDMLSAENRHADDLIQKLNMDIDGGK